MRTIRFFHDWTAPYSIWETGTDKYCMEPSDYGLSENLGRRLHLWTEHCESHIEPGEGWKTSIAEEVSRVDGDEIVALLRAEVRDFAVVCDERYR